MDQTFKDTLKTVGCLLPSSSEQSIVNAAGNLTYGVTSGVIDVLVTPELTAANKIFTGLYDSAQISINSFFSAINNGKKIPEIIGTIMLVFLCLMAFASGASS